MDAGEVTPKQKEGFDRRKLLARGIPYLVASYWRASSYLDPSALLTRALEDYEDFRQEVARQRDAVPSILRDIEGLNFTFNNGELRFTLDRATILELVAEYWRRYYAKAGISGSVFKVISQTPEGQDYDAELSLPERRIYAKLFLSAPTEKEVSFYLERARLASPCECWLFGLGEEDSNVRLDPVFVGENKVLFGRLRQLGLVSVLRDLLGHDKVVSAERRGNCLSVILRSPGRV